MRKDPAELVRFQLFTRWMCIRKQQQIKRCRLTLAPLAAVGVQVVGVEPLGFVQAIQDFPDVHHLIIKERSELLSG